MARKKLAFEADKDAKTKRKGAKKAQKENLLHLSQPYTEKQVQSKNRWANLDAHESL